jgi:chromodomain-helicase-DNA-binding protein 1
MMRIVFKPVKESLQKIKLATKELIKSRKDRASVMKNELVVIGDFIEAELKETPKDEVPNLLPRFW